MKHKHLRILGYLFATIALTLCSGAFFLFFFKGSDLSKRYIASHHKKEPVYAFSQKSSSYEAIGEPVLILTFAPPELRLPDLRSTLVYYGRNGRPDADNSNPKLHFSFNGVKSIASFSVGEKVFLTYEKKAPSCKYSFSVDNSETHLWFIAMPDASGAQVSLFMRNENGEEIANPDHLAKFVLNEKEFIRFAGAGVWEIGKWRVDGTILARQKARWFGPDRFLERHGGEEFPEILGKQRIDFEEEDQNYSVFVSAGDCLVWNENHWEEKVPGNDSVGLPLMCVRKIDDRVMNLELWDVEGKGKVMLNLIRSQENLAAQHLTQDFKFVGARTRTQCVFQINQERMIVKPNDWLLLTDSGWKKLSTLQDIDDYVTLKKKGFLFVCDEILRKDERPYLTGTVFNPTRTEMQEIQIAMQPTNVLPQTLKELVPHSQDSRMQTARDYERYREELINESSENPLATH